MAVISNYGTRTKAAPPLISLASSSNSPSTLLNPIAINYSTRRGSSSTTTSASTSAPRTNSGKRKQGVVRRKNEAGAGGGRSVPNSINAFGTRATPFDADDDDGEVTTKTGSFKKVYTCSRCDKTYRSQACISKHKWNHSDYWQAASDLVTSKHQTVQMLEAAAILIAGSSLPEQRNLWPDVVSSPTLFSHLRPQSLTVPRLSSSPYSTSTSDLDPPSEMDTPENDDDDDDEDDALQSGHENESKEEDEESSSDDFLVEDMFEMDIDAREEEEGDSGYAEIIPITGDESVKFRSLGMVSSDERTMLE